MIKVLQLLLLYLLPALATTVYAANIRVAVDRNPVSLLDSFRIIFTADRPPDGSPDFSVLQQNFDIVDQQRSSNASWINGQGSRTEEWILTVHAKQPGELLISPVAFGSDSSRPLKITVLENQGTPHDNNEEIFLDVDATPENPYVQSQVIYTMRLYRRVQITQAGLDEPQIKDAVVEKLGEDNTYSTQVNGVDYWVTERKYAIFPQQSGVVTIPPLTLNAEVLASGRSRFNSFFGQQFTEARRIVSKALTLNVKPVPANFKESVWLSGEAVTLTDHWSDGSLRTKVGEPLTRTVRLSVVGASVGQLPELSVSPPIAGLKSYPDQPVLKEDKQSDGLTAVREEKIAFIPSKPGMYTLPALEISWFNTKTQQTEVAKLPGVTMQALAVSEPVLSEADRASGAQSASPLVSYAGNGGFWQWLSGFLAVGWLLTIVGFLWRTKKKRPPATTGPDNRLPESSIEKNLKRACWENNPQTAKQIILQWGRLHFGADNLGSIAKHCQSPLSDELETLNRILYSERQQTWQGEALLRAFTGYRQEEALKSDNDGGLEPLYKL